MDSKKVKVDSEQSRQLKQDCHVEQADTLGKEGKKVIDSGGDLFFYLKKTLATY